MNAERAVNDITQMMENLGPNPEINVGHIDMFEHLDIDTIGAMHSDADENHGVINEVTIYVKLPADIAGQASRVTKMADYIYLALEHLTDEEDQALVKTARSELGNIEKLVASLAFMAGIKRKEDARELQEYHEKIATCKDFTLNEEALK